MISQGTAGRRKLLNLFEVTLRAARWPEPPSAIRTCQAGLPSWASARTGSAAAPRPVAEAVEGVGVLVQQAGRDGAVVGPVAPPDGKPGVAAVHPVAALDLLGRRVAQPPPDHCAAGQAPGEGQRREQGHGSALGEAAQHHALGRHAQAAQTTRARPPRGGTATRSPRAPRRPASVRTG
eukprot:CAMPEP_0179373462 /NCGR_PEP_ID=MMETSP0797-20121207/86810_1 /TAXON_ID=47934 /ORGANISM="Dinophysis acuminata, Strain DAEP01" /LENGTH=178 /DNA_ID=CAMNT_0021089459 /DNA_START=38 /DNA_END=572 /DNA_ORIENTATION=+